MAYHKQVYGKSLEYLENDIRAAEACGDDLLKAKCLAWTARNECHWSQCDQSLAHINEVLEIAQRLEEQELVCDAESI